MVGQSCPTLCTPGLPVHHRLLELAQTHVHRVGDAIQPSSVLPLSSCPQSFPASGTFPVSQLFTSGGQSIRVSASASVLPMNIQDWFPLGLTGWISLTSKGLSTVSSFKSVNSSALSFLYSPTLASAHDCWKKIALTRRTFVSKTIKSHSQALPQNKCACFPDRKLHQRQKKKKEKKRIIEDRHIMSRYLCKQLQLHWNIWGIWCNQSTEYREQLLQKALVNFYLHFGLWVSELPSIPTPTFLFWKALKVQKSCNDDTMITWIPFLVTNIYHFPTFAFYHSCLHTLWYIHR